MPEHTNVSNPFLLSDPPQGGRRQKIRELLLQACERALGLRRCQELYGQIDSGCDIAEFTGQALARTGAGYRVGPERLERIPRSGPCILIANHPYGGLEGLMLMNMVSAIRSDFVVMGNFLLGRIPQLRRNLLEVDPFGGENAGRKNIAPLRRALKCLAEGQLLILFPAGEVSAWQPDRKQICDPQWSTTLARLVRMSKAPVLPVYFPGSNGPLFQLAGLLHARLRTLLLPMMLLRQKGKIIEPKIGNPIPAKKLSGFFSDQQLTDYLRVRTYALKDCRGRAADNMIEKTAKPQAEIVPAISITRLEEELTGLPETQKLLDSGDFSVYYAAAQQIPQLLNEIGRLRETTFRRVGEGTGQAIDLDRFDEDYLHLFIWNREQRELVGAYRIGQVDRILRNKGAAGLYTATLFQFKPQLLERLEHALELGRSFVRYEYQRSYAPLLLLWKGIGHYLVRHPQYRYLFGPVSISSDYSERSRQLITSALTRHYQIQELSSLVSSRMPVGIRRMKISGIDPAQSDPLLQDIENISALVADFENDGKGVPVLLRHYLSLGGKLLAFNLDPDFSDVIDGLLLVDLLEADARQLQRYMERDGYRAYLHFQKEGTRDCA